VGLLPHGVAGPQGAAATEADQVLQQGVQDRVCCPGRIPHDFRRAAVRNLERAGVPRSVVMKLTGHKTESVYRRYAIADERDLRIAVASRSRQRSDDFKSINLTDSNLIGILCRGPPEYDGGHFFERHKHVSQESRKHGHEMTSTGSQP